ncbi:MAG: YceI family protein [Candidatus Solibacter sp.]
MKSVRRFVPLFAFALLLNAGDLLVVDTTQTKVEFTLPSLLHTVHGEFRLKRGGLVFDAVSGKLSGELVIDATSGDSGSAARDKKMHSAILESAKYPEIVFRPDRVEGKVVNTGKSSVQLHGMFSLHGADHEMLVPATVDAAGGAYAVNATFEIPYVKWGLKNPSTLMLRVNDKVEIRVQTRLTPSPPAHTGN